MVKSQISSLPFDLSFGHNLCFNHSNGSCKPILDIYRLRAFQWCKKIFNPMSFDPCNRPLKIQKSIRTPIPKVGAHLGVCGFIPSHPPMLSGVWNVAPGLHSWPAPLQAFALVTSPRLRLQQALFLYFSSLILCLLLYICLLLCYLMLLLPTFIYFYFCFFASTSIQCLLTILFSFVYLYLDSPYVCYYLFMSSSIYLYLFIYF
jgi:hypothetical protein